MKRIKSSLFSLLLAGAASIGSMTGSVTAHAASNAWQWENPRPVGVTLNAVVEGAAQIVAVGDYGTVITSPDGITWTERPVGTRNTLYGVTWNGTNQYIAVGFNGLIMSSLDGISWKAEASGTTIDLNSVIWNASLGQYVAVGGGSFITNPVILTSADGVTWVNRTPTSPNRLTDIVWGNAQYVAVGGAGQIQTSPDGVTWTQQVSGVTADFTSVTWSPTLSQYVAVGSLGTILTSANGIAWSPQTFPAAGFGTAHSVEWNASLGQYISVGFNGDIQTSPDGVTWTEQAAAVGPTLNAAVWSPSLAKYVAVGATTIATSPTGTAWTTQTTGRSLDMLEAAASNGSQYVAVGSGTNAINQLQGVIWTRQPPANTWTMQFVPTSLFLHDVNWSAAKAQYVAVGDVGTIYTSPDGMTWTQRTSAGGAFNYGVEWNPTLSQYVVVGGDLTLGGTIQTSPDGITWTAQTSGVMNDIMAVVWGAGQYVAVGSGGVILTSPDGMTWTTQTSGTLNILYDVAWSPQLSLYVAVGQQGIILTSSNGISWSAPIVGGDGNDLRGIAWDGTRFTAVAQSYLTQIVSSSDGINWIGQANGSPVLLNGVYWNGNAVAGEYLAVGYNGTILRSVADTTPPMLRMASRNVSFEATGPLTNVTATMAGITASDDTDKWLTATAAPAGPYAVGPHTVTWSSADTAGNIGSAVQTVTITDTTPPVITLLGGALVWINQGTTYVDAGATALDLADGDITARIVVNNTVNTAVTGTYYVGYSVTDTAGNTTRVGRTVLVLPSGIPVTLPTAPTAPAIPSSGGGGGGGGCTIEPTTAFDPTLMLVVLLSAGYLARRRNGLAK